MRVYVKNIAKMLDISVDPYFQENLERNKLMTHK